jgi:peptide chain release factor 2
MKDTLFEPVVGIPKSFEQYAEKLKGEDDSKSCFLTLVSGAKEPEVCSWAHDMMNMYKAWFESLGMKCIVLHTACLDGKPELIARATLLIVGNYAYGIGKCETGIHRCSRWTKFKPTAMLCTCFVSVEVLPFDAISVKDYEAELFYSVGFDFLAGSSTTIITAMREGAEASVTLTPATEISVIGACVKNDIAVPKTEYKESDVATVKGGNLESDIMVAMVKHLLAARLNNGAFSIAWGNIIRSYVFAPYTAIKDSRNGYETANVNGVVNGDLNELVALWFEHGCPNTCSA